MANHTHVNLTWDAHVNSVSLEFAETLYTPGRYIMNVTHDDGDLGEFVYVLIVDKAVTRLHGRIVRQLVIDEFGAIFTRWHTDADGWGDSWLDAKKFQAEA